MLNDSSKIIPLARLSKQHGHTKNGIRVFKAELLSRGGLPFSFLKKGDVIYGLQEATSLQRGAENVRSLELAEAPSPLGGKWGEAAAVLLPFAEELLSQENIAGWFIGLSRDRLPSLEPGEFYLWDVIGCEVQDEQGVSYGRVVGGYDVAPTLGSAVVLQIQEKGSDLLECPASWVDRASLEDVLSRSEDAHRILRIPGLAAWSHLKPGENSDE